MSDANESQEVDEMVSRLEATERARKRKVLFRTALILVPALVALAFAWMYREAVLGPRLDVEGGEKEVLAETDDPQCRTMITEVTRIGEDFAEYQAKIEEKILSKDAEAIEDIRLKIAEFRQRIDAVEARSGDANLRFDTNREELEAWFDYVDNELRLLDELAKDQLAILRTPQAEEPPAPSSTKPLTQRRDAALVAADDAFQNFRVWHTSSLHPCGPAAEDEEGWTPEEAMRAKAPAPKTPN